VAEVLQSLAQLGDVAKPEQPAAPVHVKKVDAQGRAYATGKRKNAIARVWIKPGSGKSPSTAVTRRFTLLARCCASCSSSRCSWSTA